MWEKRLEIEPPYDFERVLERLSLDPINHVDLLNKTVSVPIVAGEQLQIIKVQSVGKKYKPVLTISGDSNESLAIHQVADILQLHVKLAEIQAHFKQTNLAQLFTEHEGTPFIKEFSLYRCLVKAIIHQQLNVKFAHTLTERFVHNYGSKINDVWVYPTAETVASISYDELRELQFSQRKAEYVIDTSRLIVKGELDLDKLKKMTDEEVIGALVKIRGIGPWTAQNVLMFGLGRLNLLPKTDIGIQKALQKLFMLENKPTLKQIDEWSKEWSPYKSFASLYLWRSIET